MKNVGFWLSKYASEDVWLELPNVNLPKSSKRLKTLNLVLIYS